MSESVSTSIDQPATDSPNSQAAGCDLTQKDFKSERVAILVIHGIGEERPYGTLDAFTRGLLKELDTHEQWTIKPEMSQLPDPIRPGQTFARVAYRLVPPEHKPVAFGSGKVWSNRLEKAKRYLAPEKSCLRDITLFEYYWAPITKNKVKYTTSLLFLVKAGLQPFRYFASNVAAISNAGSKATPDPTDPPESRYRVLLREILRQSLLFLPIMLLLGSLLYFLSKQANLSSLGTKHVPPAVIVTALLLAIRYLYLYTSLAALMQTPWRNQGIESTKRWKLMMTAGVLFHLFVWPLALRPSVVGIAALGTWIVHTFPELRSLTETFNLHWASTLRTYADYTLNGPHTCKCSYPRIATFFLLSPCLTRYLTYALLAMLAWFVRYILINYIGDIAVYANPNQLSENFAAREQVLDGATAALAEILKEREPVFGADARPKFDRVLLAGHSLGSVIAYDSLNGLLSLARTGKGIGADDLRRMRGLVTFGSPLNKIYYFFRELDDPGATLRHRTLDLLHSFRLKSSLATNLPPVFAPVREWKPFYQALREGFTWINAYSLADPVSGRILFYDVGHEDPERDGLFITHGAQERFELGLYGAAHLGYWRSQEFYRFVVKNLL